MKCVPTLALTIVVLLSGITTLDAQAPITLYVGPQLRDGFVDVDQGVLDAIADITTELRKTPRYRLVAKPEQATLILLVLGRHSPGDSGGVGFPIGTMTAIVPIKRLAIESILKVGTYERRLLSEDEGGGTWRHAAKRTVQDLTAWVTANQHMLPKER